MPETGIGPRPGGSVTSEPRSRVVQDAVEALRVLVVGALGPRDVLERHVALGGDRVGDLLLVDHQRLDRARDLVEERLAGAEHVAVAVAADPARRRRGTPRPVCAALPP